MIEKLQIMKGKEIKQDDIGPVLIIANIIIVPVLIAALFYGAQQYQLAPHLGFLLFAGIGFYEWRSNK